MITAWTCYTMLKNIYRHIFFTLVVLISTVLLFALSDVDTVVQNYFFDFATKQWVLDRDLEPWKFIFYDGIKKLLILFAVFLLFSLLFFRKKKIVQEYKRGMIIVILSAIFVPLMVGGLKANTNMPCPKHEIHYGGEYIKTKVWEQYPQEFKQKAKIKCWPAGHASGGFALLALFFLFKTKRAKIIAIATALTIGWSMGIYKMLVGDHFLSHTIVTMILAWLIILIIVRLVNFKKESIV